MVTGSHRGIGFETARQLGQLGVRIIVSARTEREAADTASKLRSEGIEAEPLALDVTRQPIASVAAKFVDARYGKLDILVNNAGVGPADGIILCVRVNRPKRSCRASLTSTCLPWSH